MNTKYILGIAAAGICGALLAAGILKSTSSKPEEENAAAAAPAEPSVATSRTAEKAESPETAGPIAEAGDEAAGRQSEEELAARREEFRSNMRKQQMDRLTTKMAKWGAALNLDEGQKERLLEIADSQLDELEEMAVDARDSGDPAALSAAAQRAMSIIGGEALEESMTALLTPDQKRAYEEFGARQDESRAEARALRQLAGLQEDLMLSPEQRNSVYAILYEDATTEVQERDNVGSVIETVASSAGVNLDPSLQGMISSMAAKGLAELASGKELNPESIEEMSRQAYDEAVAQQVDRLRPVLTEAQLELYRSQIEARLGGLMQRVGADSAE